MRTREPNRMNGPLYDTNGEYEPIDFWFGLTHPIMWPGWYRNWLKQREEE